jgi:hypothetical protein
MGTGQDCRYLDDEAIGEVDEDQADNEENFRYFEGDTRR